MHKQTDIYSFYLIMYFFAYSN